MSKSSVLAARQPSTNATRGFTLVELLTVIAILAVLATLLLSALGGAKKKSRTARCTGNLHQLSLAINMYLDDHERRPPVLDPLLTGGYMPAAEALLCPEDKTGNWGGLVNALSIPGTSRNFASSAVVLPAGSNSMARFSYLHPLPWSDTAWDLLMKSGPSASFAACELHGLGQANLASPSPRDFEGLILRGQRDGAVVRRKLFWASQSSFASTTPASGSSLATPNTVTQFSSGDDAWPLFTDEPEPAQ